jgi:hypothetical protein
VNKVGIWGHSGGGFMSTAAMLVYPDFFKVALSESGNHENNIYNNTWSEKHHGLKELVGDDGQVTFEYDIEKNSELARNLKGHLMLSTGDIDNNVHPANTLRMADALIKDNKRFDMLVIPGVRHGYGDRSAYFNWIRSDYSAGTSRSGGRQCRHRRAEQGEGAGRDRNRNEHSGRNSNGKPSSMKAVNTERRQSRSTPQSSSRRPERVGVGLHGLSPRTASVDEAVRLRAALQISPTHTVATSLLNGVRKRRAHSADCRAAHDDGFGESSRWWSAAGRRRSRGAQARIEALFDAVNQSVSPRIVEARHRSGERNQALSREQLRRQCRRRCGRVPPRGRWEPQFNLGWLSAAADAATACGSA